MLVVSCGVCVVDGGGHLWAVVKFVIVGGDVVGTRCGGASRGAHIVAGDQFVMVVGGGGCW